MFIFMARRKTSARVSTASPIECAPSPWLCYSSSIGNSTKLTHRAQCRRLLTQVSPRHDAQDPGSLGPWFVSSALHKSPELCADLDSHMLARSSASPRIPRDYRDTYPPLSGLATSAEFEHAVRPRCSLGQQNHGDLAEGCSLQPCISSRKGVGGIALRDETCLGAFFASSSQSTRLPVHVTAVT